MDRTQGGVILRLTGAFRTTSTEALQVVAGVAPLHLLIQKRAAIYWLNQKNPNRAKEILGVELRTPEEVSTHIAQTLRITSTKAEDSTPSYLQQTEFQNKRSNPLRVSFIS